MEKETKNLVETDPTKWAAWGSDAAAQFYIKGWRACEFHFQKVYRKKLAEELQKHVQGFQMSFSDEQALSYFNEKTE